MKRLLCLAPLLLCLTACNESAEPPAASAAPTTVRLDTLRVERTSVAHEIRFDGVIEATNQATVAAQTGGRVVELPYDVGDLVPQGAIIVRITAKEQEAGQRSAQANLDAAAARQAEAKHQFERVRDLLERKLVARADFDRARAALDTADAAVLAAREALNQASEQAGYTVVRAPYAGIVLKRHVEPGETVSPGTPLMTGLSLEQLRVAVDIPQQHIGPLRAHKSAHVILPDGRTLPVSALRIAPGADPDTHTFAVLASLPAGDYGVFPGTLVKLAFVTEEEDAMLLPQSALVRRAELEAVYVLDESGRISLRYVRLGDPRADSRVPVLSGLSAGETVASDPLAAAQAYREQTRTRQPIPS